MAIDGIAVGDFKGLQDLRQKAQTDPNQALPEVSKQFEAIFLQSMLKSMRMGQHFIDDKGPFRSDREDMFQDMLDGEYASVIANSHQSIGLAAMLAKQLSRPEEAGAVQAKGIDQTKITVRNQPSQGLPMPSIEKQPMPLSAPLAARTTPVEATSHNSVDDFVKSTWPYARQAASLLGLDPKILLAQAALETGWGQYVAKGADGASSNNFFNIKSAKNAQDSVEVQTTEYLVDTPIRTNSSFRKYPSVAHSFNDYVSLIKGSERYEAALANSNNPERYVDELRRAGYATDPLYASKILAIYHGEELQQSLERNGFSIA